MSDERQRRICRIDWFRTKVTNLPYISSKRYEEGAPLILGNIDYREISPPIETQADFGFLFATPFKYVERAIWLCLHMFFSLPCLGLSTDNMELPSTKKRRTEAVTSTSESQLEATPLSGTYNNTGYYPLNDILHFVGMSTESHELIDSNVLNGRYQRLNDLASTLSFDDLDNLRYTFGSVRNTYSLDSGNEGSWEQNTQEAFADHVLKPFQAIFQGLFPTRKFTLEALNNVYRNLVNKSDKKDYQARPDRMFSVDGVPLVCIEVKYPSIKFGDEFMHVFSQAVYQCICSKTPYGIITDYETVFTFKLELNDEELERIKQHTDEINKGRYSHRLKRLKITYRSVECINPLHTPSAVVFDHFLDAYLASLDKEEWYRSQNLMTELAKALTLSPDDLNQRAKDEYDEFFSILGREQSTDANKVFVDIGDGESKECTIVREVLDDSEFEALQEGSHANAQVLKIGQSFFERITGLKADADSYILKIFDPVHGKREDRHFVFSKRSFMKIIKQTALREFEIYRKLKDLWGICVPKFFHFGCCVLEHEGKVRFGGLFMVLQYLEGPPPNTMDETLFISARQHLNEIHKKGVVHKDVKPRNMVNHRGKVFFIDFGHSTVIPYGEEDEEDDDGHACYRSDGEVRYFDLRDSDSSKLRDVFKVSKTPS